MILTTSQVQQCCPLNKSPTALTNALNKFLPAYNIKTLDEITGFVSECAHESDDFTHVIENLNYSADLLCKTWPKRFPDLATANIYARQPQKIANKVYASRMGNGDEASGDGWLYHGRGAIQLTGKDNYQAFADYKKVNISTLPAYMETIEGAIESACWYWMVHKLNISADQADVIGMTKIINGGLIGISDRQEKFNMCLTVLS